MEGSRSLDPSAVLTHRVARSPVDLESTQPDDEWLGAETSEVSHWEWPDAEGPENGPQGVHRPRVTFETCYDARALAVRFRCRDDGFVRCAKTRFNEQVCRDSCVEFFVAPVSDSDDGTPYLNFECNAAGTMLIYHCTRGDRGSVELSLEDAATVRVFSSLDPNRATAADVGALVDPEISCESYAVEYHIPFALFSTYFPDAAAPGPGSKWRCNFYKCGDETSHPHWGTWAPVGTPRPNFHRPSDFQELVFA